MEPSSLDSDRRLFQRIGLIAIFIALLDAGLAGLGWVTGWNILSSLRPDLIPMAPSTTLAFLVVLATTAVFLTGSGREKLKWAAPLATLLVALFGLLEAIQYYTGLNIDLEDQLVPSLGYLRGNIPLGRMSPGSGALFLLAGLALLALFSPPTRFKPHHPARDFAGTLAILISASGLTFLIAYILNEPLMYGIAGLVPVSLLAAIGFICLGIALAAAAGPQAFPGRWFCGTSTRARLLRALAPVFVLVGLFIFIADPMAHALSGNNLALATAIMAVSYMLMTGLVFGLAARGIGRTIDRVETERKQTADELTALFAAIQDVVLVYDADGRYLQIAPTNPSLQIKPASQMLGKTVHEILPPEQARLIQETIRRALNEGRTVQTTYSLPINGAETWFEGIASPLTEKTVFFVARDVTASREAVQALRESEARFRTITEQLNDLIALTDRNGVIIYASPASLPVFGVTPQEMVGQHFASFLDKSAIPAAQAAFEQDMANDIGFVGLELLMKRADGSLFTGELNGSRIQSGSQPGSLVTIRDISERKRSEDALQRLAAIVESSDDAIIGKDLDGIILNWNKGAELLYGYPASEVLGKPVSILLPPDRPDDIPQILATVRAGGRLHHFETVRRTRDGRDLDVSLTISPIKSSNGQIVGASTIARDITDRKQAEEHIRQLNLSLEKRVEERTAELQLANLDLARAARMKDEFLASMSHELRTPLTGVLGLSESLQMNTYGDLTEKQQRILKLIEDSGRHLLELINDILDLSKIEAGKFDLQLEACSLAAVCQSSLQLTRSLAQKKRLQTSFSIEPEDIFLRADVRRMKQMLVNLLSNAIKFTPEGGSLGIEIHGLQAEQKVRITVWDTGIGIAPEDLPRLFQVFVQLDSKLSRQYAGTGLGLALVKRLAELHNGSVEVESTPGQGSRFSILLPWEAAALEIKVPAETAPGTFRTSMTFDDDDAHADLLTLILKNLGIHNINQPVALGAVDMAAAFVPDVLLVHFNLPDKPGLRLLAEFKADTRTRGIPVVLMSAGDDRTEALAAGADGFLLRPVSQSQVQTGLARLVARTVLPVVAPKPLPVVILADDDRIVIEVISDFLRTRGFVVFAFPGGAELLEKIESVHADVALIDIQMPGVTGLEVIRRIRAHKDASIAGLPVIAVTALAMSGDRERCLEAGANEYMSKPVKLDELARTIQALLE